MSAARSALFAAPSVRDGEGPRTRVVERLRIHGDPIDFRELCLRAVPERTRILVMDLDRTVHLAQNMGELLGWEICAHLGYGPSYLDELEPTRGGGRMFFAPERPLATLKYLAIGAKLWGPPGLFYLLWGKIAWRASALRRRAFLRFGPEAVRAVQRVPQHALLHQIASLPRKLVRELATRVFRRYAADQCIEAADIAWLRARCPGIKIVISSASPRPVVEAAGEALGVDAVVCTEVEEDDDSSTAPCDLSRMGRPSGAPRRISRPSRQHINAGPAKLQELVARFPELLDPSVESVGITDTGYGEDHSWTELFRTLIDVNSTAPFPPIVDASSPTRVIHSALLRTRKERDSDFVDPRRGHEPRVELDLSQRDLEERLGPVVDDVESLARDLESCERSLANARASARDELCALDPELERTVERYNAGHAEALLDLERLLARRRVLAARVVEIERPISERAYALTVALEHAREQIVREPPTATTPLVVRAA